MEEIFREPDVHPSRLCAAADALLEAIHSPRGFDSRITMSAGPSRLGGLFPPTVFTSEELLAAIAMLIRLGLIPEHVFSRRAGTSSR